MEHRLLHRLLELGYLQFKLLTKSPIRTKDLSLITNWEREWGGNFIECVRSSH
jgi:hypothetical protein